MTQMTACTEGRKGKGREVKRKEEEGKAQAEHTREDLLSGAVANGAWDDGRHERRRK